MGKGDKKTKRGKIIIGSSGVRRTRKKKGIIKSVAPKAEPKPVKDAEELVIPAVKPAPKKTAKKVVEQVEGAEVKPKAVKTKKKKTEGEEEPAHEEPSKD